MTPEELETQYQAEDDKGEDTVYYTFDFALYLLGQFREQQAFLPILKFFLTPGDLTQDITGDIVTDSLGELLAATYSGDISALTGVVSDEQVSDLAQRTRTPQEVSTLYSTLEVKDETKQTNNQALYTTFR